MSRKPRGSGAPRQPLDVDHAELQAIVDRARLAPLSADEHAKLAAVIDTLAFLTAELQAKGTSIARLRELLFGTQTVQSEKTQHLFDELAGSAEKQDGEPQGPRPKAPGHGRHGAAAYSGAETVVIPHPTLRPGDTCPDCARGRIRPLAQPVRAVRIRGIAPLYATVYEKQRLRCASCGEVFTAPSPAGVGEDKYDETATAMIGLCKYGSGLPFYRIEKLSASMGIPLPASTQWELVRDGAAELGPVHEELLRQAAQAKVLYNDDTTAKILDLTPEHRAAAGQDEGRTGVFTSGIVATALGHEIAVFCTGVQHAGENLADVLARRQSELPPPIQMCDALPSNTAGDFKTILANCLAHARRKYVEVAVNFPAPCRHVLEVLGKVYGHDAEAKKQGLSPARRLALHQELSQPLMEALAAWMQQQIDERQVEPNSGLGLAISYMQRHWAALTLFLREPGCPIDSNLVERALKKVILHRKNALFFKTMNGARVADLYMSLIHTCELERVSPFDYLVALLRHPQAVARAPADWMPWTYRAALTSLT